MSPLSTASLIGASMATASAITDTAMNHVAHVALMPPALSAITVLIVMLGWPVFTFSALRDRARRRAADHARRQATEEARALVRRYGIDPDYLPVEIPSVQVRQDAVILYADFGRGNREPDRKRHLA